MYESLQALVGGNLQDYNNDVLFFGNYQDYSRPRGKADHYYSGRLRLQLEELTQEEAAHILQTLIDLRAK